MVVQKNRVGPVRCATLAALLIAGTVALDFYLISRPLVPARVTASWIATALAMVGLLGLIGLALNGRLLGVVIDGRNRVSLSKAQAMAWTVVVTSAIVAFAMVRARSGTPALEFDIPGQLVIAMGISAASLVAAPGVLSLKTGALPSEVQAAAAEKVEMKSVDGLIAGRHNPVQASWLDMFRGDEVGNAASADLSKAQQFLITLVLLGVYAAAIGDQLHALDVSGLPVLTERQLWLLGISHAGYIGYKAVPHSGAAAAAQGPQSILNQTAVG